MVKNKGFMFVKDWKPIKGMMVYVVPDDNRDKPSVGKVTSIGRKYFSVNLSGQTLKFDIDLKNRNERPIATCYQSEEKYQQSIELCQKIQIIQDNTHYLTPEQIDTVFYWIVEKSKENIVL